MNVLALQRFFDDQSQKKQNFGTIDCVSFVAGALLAGWNRDYTGDLQYHNRRSAVNRLRAFGGLRCACDWAFGDQVSIAELGPGDVVWFDKPATIGLLMPGYVAVKLGRSIHRYQIESQMMGWKTDKGTP